MFSLYFEWHIALCCVLQLKEMSVNLTDNLLAENCWYFFLHFYLQYRFLTDIWQANVFFSNQTDEDVEMALQFVIQHSESIWHS